MFIQDVENSWLPTSLKAGWYVKNTAECAYATQILLSTSFSHESNLLIKGIPQNNPDIKCGYMLRKNRCIHVFLQTIPYGSIVGKLFPADCHWR